VVEGKSLGARIWSGLVLMPLGTLGEDMRLWLGVADKSTRSHRSYVLGLGTSLLLELNRTERGRGKIRISANSANAVTNALGSKNVVMDGDQQFSGPSNHSDFGGGAPPVVGRPMKILK
jgi:hypothetical protein